jgi:tetratricopeptide (TPR) repeat protein
MVVAAGLGFNALIDLVKNNYAKIALTVLPILLLAPPLFHIVRNHPYEYIYFNELAGGIDKVYGNYELDYYYHSTREASEWILANASKQDTEDKIKVATYHSASVDYFFRKDTADFQVSFSRWYDRGNNDWDYAIFTITNILPEQIKSEHFPPKNTVHTIDVDGKPICLILKNDDKSELKGYGFRQESQMDSAVFYFEKALEIDPYNETAMTSLIDQYFLIRQEDKAKPYIDSLLAFFPHYDLANYYLAYYYYLKNDLDEALNIAKKIIAEDNYRFTLAYYIICNIYIKKNDMESAEKIMNDLIETDSPVDDIVIKQLIAIYRAQGLSEAAAYKKLYKKIAANLKKKGQKEAAARYENRAKSIN